mmetsp:Transcript_14020/g.27853  ORF Transcript_14020/g.27853 Transcript_14020/m.27853 type:complete len:328 (-) Transcript_14020:1242-2225(-)
MYLNVVLLVDFSQNNHLEFSKLDLDFKISFICSLIIGWVLNFNPKNQLSILVIRGGSVEQITHLSGNKKHHFQGLRRLMNLEKKNGINLEISFSLAVRLLGPIGKKEVKKLIFLNSGKIDNFFSHGFCANIIKRGIVFSTISFQHKIFILELLTKLTKGEYILSTAYSKKEIFSLMKSNLSTSNEFSPAFLGKFGPIKAEIFPAFFPHVKKKKTFLKKIKRYCPKCHCLLKNFEEERCTVCGIFFMKEECDKILDFFGSENLKSQKKNKEFFSIFSCQFSKKNYLQHGFKQISKKRAIDFLKISFLKRGLQFYSERFQRKEIFSSSL